ncbi:response regulator, partial [Klebsiella pneumoniae]|nr:response regulator [Klebsiella pneumoniae]
MLIRKEMVSLIPNILIVDDDPHIRELVSVFLEREGFQTYEAIDGLDALQKINEVKVDMVIL